MLLQQVHPSNCILPFCCSHEIATFINPQNNRPKSFAHIISPWRAFLFAAHWYIFLLSIWHVKTVYCFSLMGIPGLQKASQRRRPLLLVSLEELLTGRHKRRSQDLFQGQLLQLHIVLYLHRHKGFLFEKRYRRKSDTNCNGLLSSLLHLPFSVDLSALLRKSWSQCS